MCPATFSPTTQVGFVLRTTLNIAGHKWRSSPCPPRFPARLNGWHGYPPCSNSILGNSLVSMVRTSSKILTSGQCLRSTFWQKSSRSQKATVLNPAHSAARSSPPIPENKLKAFIVPSKKKKRITRRSSGAAKAASLNSCVRALQNSESCTARSGTQCGLHHKVSEALFSTASSVTA